MPRPNAIRRSLAATILAALAAAGASCSTADEVTVQSFLVQNAALLCRSFGECGAVVDEPACEASLGPEGGSDGQRSADLAAGRVVFDRLAAADCLDFRRRHRGDCDGASRRADPGGAACERVFVGVVAAGGACFRDGECDEGFCRPGQCACDPGQGECGCCAGTCVPAVGLGEPCGDAACTVGLRCSFEPGATTPRCAALREPGEPCDGPFTCVDSVVCVQSTRGEAGLCGAPPGEGEPCHRDGNPSCSRSDDWCDPTTLVCTRRLPLGAPCVMGTIDGPCGLFAVCNEGTCAGPPGEGEPCFTAPEALFKCGGGLICKDAICVINPDIRPFTFAVCK
jgi:hypothetical protein